jgi:hypothetical protein
VLVVRIPNDRWTGARQVEDDLERKKKDSELAGGDAWLMTQNRTSSRMPKKRRNDKRRRQN